MCAYVCEFLQVVINKFTYKGFLRSQALGYKADVKTFLKLAEVEDPRIHRL